MMSDQRRFISPRPRRRGKVVLPRKVRWPDLEVAQILEWADAHYGRTGSWPTRDAGIVGEAPREKWYNIDAALRHGLRSLPPGSSLARLLAEHRGVRNRKGLPPYAEPQLLRWADAHHQRTGEWPTRSAGAIPDAPGETWMAVDMALSRGLRGLPGGSSLAQLLAGNRGVRNKQDLPPYTEEEILGWADAHCRRTGRWPAVESGSIADAPGETWNAVNHALSRGMRGLPGGSSLAKLLAAKRGVPNRMDQPPLTVAQILQWADACFARTGRWPKDETGPIPEAPGETWSGVNGALRAGRRGLPAGSSLARLLAQHRCLRYRSPGPEAQARRRLTVDQLLQWADAHRARTGKWPTGSSGPIADAPGQTWQAIDLALKRGHRGLPGGSSLAQLVAERRGARNRTNAPPLTEELILTFADAYRRRIGQWPTVNSGAVEQLPGDTWESLNRALSRGFRGLPGGSSLARLLASRRGVRNIHDLPRLTEEQILAWADAHFGQAGQWPRQDSGPIADAPGETWAGIDNCLRGGHRGLPGGSSLARLLQQHRGVPNRKARPELSVKLILQWADAHYARRGSWPQVQSGPIEDAPGETWTGVESALQQGSRGLPGGSSLARLLLKFRKVPIRGRGSQSGPAANA